MKTRILIRLKNASQVLLHGSIPPSKRTYIPAISSSEVLEVKTFFQQDKFFIYGHARSGTTLLTRLIRIHPMVHCNYQGHFFTRSPLLESLVNDEQVEAWLTRRSNRWNQGRDLSPLVMRACCDFIMERDARTAGKGDPACKVGDKSPNSLLDGEAVQLMVNIYPDARLIFIIRDGRDAAISHRFQAFIDNPNSLNRDDLRIRKQYADDPEPFLNGTRSIFTKTSLEQYAHGWVQNVTETDQIARDLIADQYFSLRYEDLLHDPYQKMADAWKFLGVDPDAPGVKDSLNEELRKNPDADWQREKAGEFAGSFKKGKTGSWQTIFTPEDRVVFHQIAGDTLSKWGYEE